MNKKRFKFYVLVAMIAMLSGCHSQLLKKAEPYHGMPYHAPTTQTPPNGVKRIAAAELKAAIEADNSLILIDVYGAIFREESLDFDGAWLVSTPRKNIPNSAWLPNVGKQTLKPVVEQYFRSQLIELTNNDRHQAIVFYCIEDCWMAWNAAKRAHKWGYSNVMWFREGVDGWKDINGELEGSEPINLPVND
jgi:PQQ-dependent catabolism-associated CXXCW motif protein